VIAGHRGEREVVLAHLDDPDEGVREAALGALDRIGILTDDQLEAAFGDPSPRVRRRAAVAAATRPGPPLLTLLHDDDPSVVEVAAWSCGERSDVDEATLGRLIELATRAGEALVRESSVAALGAIGDSRGLPAILSGVDDKPNVRRRAVLALAPFDGPQVEAAIDRALGDRDWQVRQAAEDLRRATGEVAID
jgi:HEAT repeat protein